MQRILRAARYEARSVLIGDAVASPAELEISRLHRPPPPLPPSVDSTDDGYADEFDIVSAVARGDRWESGTTWDEDDAPPGAAEGGNDPPAVDTDTLQKFAEAEEMLRQATVEADEIRAAAAVDAERIRAQAHEDVGGARMEAAEIRQSASDDADLIRQEATEAGRELGYTEGREQGYQEGLARAEAETTERIATVSALAESAAVDRRELLRNAEGEVVRLALQVARKVLNRELRLDPVSVARIAEAALQQVAIDGAVKLRVNPAEYEALSTYWQRAHGVAEADRTYEIISDEAVTPGGVIIDTRAGTVDARIETQLEEISQKVFVEQTT
jgi:flagellar assembly protein FliH